MASVPNDHLGPWNHGAPIQFEAWRIPAPVAGTLPTRNGLSARSAAGCIGVAYVGAMTRRKGRGVAGMHVCRPPASPKLS